MKKINFVLYLNVLFYIHGVLRVYFFPKDSLSIFESSIATIGALSVVLFYFLVFFKCIAANHKHKVIIFLLLLISTPFGSYIYYFKFIRKWSLNRI